MVGEEEGDAEVARIEEGGDGEKGGGGDVEDVRLEVLDHAPTSALPVERQDNLRDTKYSR